MNIVAIDNGLNGAIVQIDPDMEILQYAIMPNKKEGKRNRVDELELYNIMCQFPSGSKVVIEKPVGSKSLQAATSMADSFARTITVCRICNLDVHTIAARTWQTPMFKGVSGADTKEKADKVFRKIFNKYVETFMVTAKGNKSINLHDGLVDAANIAAYAQHTGYNE